MELFGDLGKAFNLFWMASNKLTDSLEVSIRLPVEARLRALKVSFQNAEGKGDQAEMLRLAKDMVVLGNDLASYRRQAVG